MPAAAQGSSGEPSPCRGKLGSEPAATGGESSRWRVARARGGGGSQGMWKGPEGDGGGGRRGPKEARKGAKGPGGGRPEIKRSKTPSRDGRNARIIFNEAFRLFCLYFPFFPRHHTLWPPLSSKTSAGVGTSGVGSPCGSGPAVEDAHDRFRLCRDLHT